MGVRGQRPKPSETKRRAGDPGHQGSKLGVDPQGKGKPWMPPHLTPEERKLWADAVGSLPSYVLSRADSGVLQIYATAWARLNDCETKIRKTGILVNTPNGPKRNPLFVLQEKAVQQMMRAASELGLTPVARARLSRPEHETDPDDVFENFIFSGDDEEFTKVIN